MTPHEDCDIQRVPGAIAEWGLLRAAVHAAVEPWALLAAVRDEGGRVIDFTYHDVNHVAAAQRGQRREELLGSSLTEVLPEVAPRDLLARYADCIDTGRPLILDEFSYFEGSPDGEQLRRYEIRGARVQTDYLSLTWRDVTDRCEVYRRLLESEERYRLLFDNSSDVVVHFRDGAIVWISPSVTTALGAPPQHWIGQQMHNLIPAEDLSTLAAILAENSAGATGLRRLRVLDAAGAAHWVQVYAKTFFGADGRPDGRTATLRIIDDEVAAEQERDWARRRQADTDALYRRSVESSAVGMCLALPTGAFLQVNQALCDFFGYDAETLLTKTWIELTAPDYLQADLDHVADMVAGRIESYRMVKRFIHADGHSIWGDLSVSCLRNPEGTVAVSIGQIVDITDEVAAEEAVARYRQVIEKSSIGINIVRPDGPVVWINRAMCDMFGLDVAAARQTTWQQMTPETNLAGNLRVVEDLMAGRANVVRVTQQYARADGEQFWADVSVSCLTDSNGNPEYLFTQMLDVTDRVEAQQRLTKELDSAARYMTSVLPEDLRGPVRVSSLYLPTRYLGGDCFDYRWLDDDHLVITLLDVSGHGVEPALLSVSVHNLLRSGSMSPEVLRSPQRVLTELNRLFPMERNGGHYFTIWYGIYQPSTRTLTYASAGHPPALAFTPNGNDPVQLRTKSRPIGVLPDGEFPSATYQVDPGAQILLYSDGAYELKTPDGGWWSLDDFITMCGGLAKSPDWSLGDLVADLRNHSAGDTFNDDCSLIQIDFADEDSDE